MSGDFDRNTILLLGEINGTVKQIEKKVDGLSARVAVLEERRGGWFDWFLKTGIGTVIGGVIMAVITKMTAH